MRKIVPTDIQIERARRIVRQAEMDGRTPNPATVALANGDIDALNAIAASLPTRKPIKASK